MFSSEGAALQRWQSLADSAGWNHCGCADEAEFLTLVSDRNASCLLFDIRHPRGLALLEQTTTKISPMAIAIAITGAGDVSSAVAAMKAGAFDAIEISLVQETFMKKIGEALSRCMLRRENLDYRHEILSRLQKLSKRERLVLDLVLAGKLNKQIAIELNIVSKTVEAHRSHVMLKMGASSLAELARMVHSVYASAGEIKT